MNALANPRAAAAAGVAPVGTWPIVWTFAGTDPSGGAGIQADLKTIHGLGAYGASVITAVIAQNTQGVFRTEPVEAGLVGAQIDALADDLPPRAVKTGMLGTADIVRVVADRLEKVEAPVVCDPVLASSSGQALLDREGVQVLRERLLPRVDVLTPNWPEAAVLTGLPVRNPEEIEAAARRLHDLGARAVWIKGGHGTGSWSSDMLWEPGAPPVWISAPRLPVSHTHGTGCTLSAALAAALAHGLRLIHACEVARAYVQQGLRLGGGIGRGRGPLFHGGWPDEPRDYPAVRHGSPPCGEAGSSRGTTLTGSHRKR